MTLSAPPLIPSYGQGFNRFAQWPHLKFLVAPFLGPTALTLYDHSLDKRHGALTNMTVSDWETCQYGAFLNLDGVNDRIDHPNVQDNAGIPQTLMMWLRPDDVTKHGYLLCHHVAGDAAFANIFAMRGIANGDIYLLADTSANTLISRSAAGALTQDVWQQVTITWDGGLLITSVNHYVNGILQAKAGAGNQNGTGVATAATGTWSLGGRAFDNTRNLDGGFFLMSWWDYVMPLAEIHKHFQDPHLLLREVE